MSIESAVLRNANTEAAEIHGTDKIEKTGLVITETMDKAIEAANQFFRSHIHPEQLQEFKEVHQPDGTFWRIGKNEQGHTYKEYYNEVGSLMKRRVSLGNKTLSSRYYDENGVPFITKVKKLDRNKAETIKTSLAPNYRYEKNGFSSVTDTQGRVIEASIDDILPGSDKTNTNGTHVSEIMKGDHRGHLIASSLGGPNLENNLVAMGKEINQSEFRKLEKYLKKLKQEYTSVGYTVKPVYIGRSKRPSSFIVEIRGDGKILENHKFKRIENLNSLNFKKIIPFAKVDELSIQEWVESKAKDIPVINSLQKGTIRTLEYLSNAPEVKASQSAILLTAPISTVKNFKSFLEGEMGAEEVAVNIAKETGAAGGLAYISGLGAKGLSTVLQKTGVEFLQTVGSGALPATAVSFLVQSYSDITDFVTGKQDAGDFAIHLGDHAASIAGSAAGGAAGTALGVAAGSALTSALSGSAIGSVAGPAGTALGFAGGLAGAMVGCAMSTSMYEAAVEQGLKIQEPLKEQIGHFKDAINEAATSTIPDKAGELMNNVNTFFQEHKISF